MAAVTGTSRFTDALRKGHGRAMLILRADPGSTALQAELLTACKANLVFDPQCEPGRGDYLARLIGATGQRRAYWDALLGGLAGNATPDFWDKVQMFEVLCQLAAADATLDRVALRHLVAGFGFDDGPWFMAPYVASQGIEGLAFCFRHFARFIGQAEWNEDQRFHGLVDTLIVRDGLAAARQISEARAADPELGRLLNMVEARSPVPQENPALDRAAILDLVARHRHIPPHWRRDASAEDLEWVADRLLNAADEQQAWIYLGVFLRRPFPGRPERIFPLVRSGDFRLASRASTVLGQVGDPGVRALALTLAAEGRDPRLIVHLLANTIGAGDFAMIETFLTAERDEEAYHGLGLGILDAVCAPPRSEESRACLLHLYDHTPCSACRERVVSRLVALGAVPGRIVEECQFDAVAATAAHVRVQDGVAGRPGVASGAQGC